MGSTTPSQGLRYPWVDDVITDAAQGNLGADIAAGLTTQDTARSLVLKRPYVVVASSTQATADGTDTAIIWTVASTDPYTLWSAGTPTRITPGTANIGMWKYSLDVQFSISAATKLQLSVAVTGTTKSYRSWFHNVSTNDHFSLSGSQFIAAGTDYLEFKVLHNGAGSQNILGATAAAWQVST